MKRIGVVALNTFREAVRDRVLYNLLFFALVMMAASIIAGQISIGIEETVIATLERWRRQIDALRSLDVGEQTA